MLITANLVLVDLDDAYGRIALTLDALTYVFRLRRTRAKDDNKGRVR